MIKLSEIAHQFKQSNDVFPAVIVNDGSITTFEETVQWVKQNQQQFDELLDKSGAVLFRGFPIDSAETFDSFSASFGYPNFTYKESFSNAVRINFTERVFTANEAPKEVEIYLHNEMAQTPIYPDKIFFFCLQPADEGGASPLMRCDLFYQALQKKAPDLAKDFAEKGVKYTTIMPAEDNPTSGQGRSWKNTLNVQSVEEAEEKLQRLGYRWQWLHSGELKAITGVLPAVRILENGRTVFFNQLIAAYLGWKGVREHHQETLCFGDDSEIPKAGLELVCELSNDYIFDVQWQKGDVAWVDNNMVMHGRRPYAGDTKRQVLVALGAAKVNQK